MEVTIKASKTIHNLRFIWQMNINIELTHCTKTFLCPMLYFREVWVAKATLPAISIYHNLQWNVLQINFSQETDHPLYSSSAHTHKRYSITQQSTCPTVFIRERFVLYTSIPGVHVLILCVCVREWCANVKWLHSILCEFWYGINIELLTLNSQS